SAATRDLQSPTHPYLPFRGPCHPDAPRLLSSRGAQRRGICSPPLTLVPFRGPCHPDAPRLLSSRGAQRRGICSSPLTLTFRSEALVIPTPHACCHPEERSDEGSAVPAYQPSDKSCHVGFTP